MAEEMISKERIDYTIDLLITMAVEEIAEDDAWSGINSLPLQQFNIHKFHGLHTD